MRGDSTHAALQGGLNGSLPPPHQGGHHSGARGVTSQRRRPRLPDPSRASGNPDLITDQFKTMAEAQAASSNPFGGPLQGSRSSAGRVSPTLVGGGDEDEEGSATVGLSYAQALRLETLDRSSRLSHWMSAFAADEESFASKAVFVEMLLRQALSSSVTLGVPNTFRCAVVCDAFERVAPMTGRYDGVLVIIWKELVKAIFMDYSPDLPGSGAKAYAERTPYFLSLIHI